MRFIECKNQTRRDIQREKKGRRIICEVFVYWVAICLIFHSSNNLFEMYPFVNRNSISSFFVNPFWYHDSFHKLPLNSFTCSVSIHVRYLKKFRIDALCWRPLLNDGALFHPGISSEKNSKSVYPALLKSLISHSICKFIAFITSALSCADFIESFTVFIVSYNSFANC